MAADGIVLKVRAMFGPHLIFLSSTINGYEGAAANHVGVLKWLLTGHCLKVLQSCGVLNGC